LIQETSSSRNFDSNSRPLRFDCCAFGSCCRLFQQHRPVSDAAYGGSGCFLPAIMLVCTAPTAVRDCASTSSAHVETLSAYPDQAVTLRRRRICDPLVASDDSLEFACRPIRYCSRLRGAMGPGVADVSRLVVPGISFGVASCVLLWSVPWLVPMWIANLRLRRASSRCAAL
jgi:hypothetical protein